MTQPEFKSPRKIEEEVRQYRAKRFEDYMQMEDRGEITRAVALTALREEIAYSEIPSQYGSQVTVQNNRVA